MAQAIKDMNIRGAPAIGVAAAMGMALAAIETWTAGVSDRDEFLEYLKQAQQIINSTRPTAVNLFWGTNRIITKALETDGTPEDLKATLIAEAQAMWQEDIDRNMAIGKHGAELIADGDTILTHCNAGSLATVQYGTALAPIRTAFAQGKQIQVIADETRPRLQGATLTAFELHYDGIPVRVAPDGAAGLLMTLGFINKVIVGADRIVQDAVFNKIGTFMVALAAAHHHIPFYVAAPTSTLSLSETAAEITIEQRSGEEVALVLGQIRILPEGVEAINYAFDRTPMDFITGIITEDGVFTPTELLNRYA